MREFFKSAYDFSRHAAVTRHSPRTYLIYDFPQLKDSANGSALTYGGETVAVLRDGGRDVELASGYRLSTRRVEDGSSYRIEAFIEKTTEPASYQGTLTLGRETRGICFALSPEKVDAHAGDPDVSQGVFVSQAIPSFDEKGPAYSADCASILEFNGDYLKTCSGLFLIGAATNHRGDAFTQMERYDGEGKLKIQPAGTFEFKRIDACSN